jgi:prepilin-type N-terminal cleavage/methylation domain-containing protein
LVNKNGFTLIETLIGVTLLSFVIVTVLGAFSQIQLNTKHVSDKNLAVVLAESLMEETLKYPGSTLTATTTIDYAFRIGNSFHVQAADPLRSNQFRRTMVISTDPSDPTQLNLMNVRVTVEYANRGGNYPARITLNSRRGG